MNRDDLSERFFRTFSALLNLPREQLSDQSSRETVEAWDSLKHMHLVLALEEEFDIEFSDDEVSSLNTVPRLMEAIGSKLAAPEG